MPKSGAIGGLLYREGKYCIVSTGRSRKGEIKMADSVYKVITLIGTSSESWEKAAATAVQRASETLDDLRVAEIKELDMLLEEGRVVSYRAKVRVSFKYREEEPG
jgi:flavin-binding protein dodecin